MSDRREGAMDCAEFECELAELMGGEMKVGERHARLRGLRDHARDCPTCEATLDLLDLLDLPVAARDIVEDPGGAYWSSFDDRLQRRIQELPSRRASIWALASAAAAAVILLIVGWNPEGRRAGFARPGAEEPIPFDLVHADPLEMDPIVFPVAIDELLDRVTPDEAGVAVEFVGLESWPDEFEIGPDQGSVFGAAKTGLFPDTTDLESGVRAELLQWLNSQTGV